MAEKQTRGPYTGGSRSTAWRRAVEEREAATSDCDCEYHRPSSSSSSCDCIYHRQCNEGETSSTSSCNCTYHKEGDTSSDSSCNCEYHKPDPCEFDCDVDTKDSVKSSVESILFNSSTEESDVADEGTTESAFNDKNVTGNGVPCEAPISTISHDGSSFNQQPCEASVNISSPIHIFMEEDPDSAHSDLHSSAAEDESIPSTSSDSDPGWLPHNSDENDSGEDEAHPHGDPGGGPGDPDPDPNGGGPGGGPGDPDPDPNGGGHGGDPGGDDGDPDGDPGPDEGGHGGDPAGGHGDPDGDGDPDYSSSSDSDAGDENFSFDNHLLDRLFISAQNRTAREILALVVALSAKQNLDYKTLVGICRIFNVSAEIMVMPGTKEQLWSILKKKAAGIQRHGYCSECFNYLGRMSTLARRVVCEECGTSKLRKHIKYFITLSIRKQLVRLLSIPDIWEYLQYRYHREKLNPEGLEEIFDGEGYRALLEKEDGLREPFDFSYLLNNDGFSVSKSSNTMAHPIFFRINEFIPSLRQKMTLLAGMWLDETEPDFNLFFDAFVTEANSLSQDGIRWKPNGNDEVVSRFFPTAFCMDAKARASVMNFNNYSGNSGCSFCEHPGVKLEGAMKYPMPGTDVIRLRRNGEEQIIHIPEVIPVRTDAGVRADMRQAMLQRRKVHGIKGLSVMMNLRHFNLGFGCSPDDLHPVYIGVTKFLTQLMIDNVENPEAFMREIDRRMQRIRTPTLMSRKPRSISKRNKWKGTEWRNWLLYFAVVCIHGHHNNPVPRQVIDLFALLSKAIFLLSRDSISHDDINEAERCLFQFATRFQNIYGSEQMRFNVHIMLHLASAVRIWGGLHLHSTFSFESLNGKFKKYVKSPNGAINQIVNRYLLFSLALMLSLHPDLDEEVVEEIDFILSGNTLPNPDRVGNAYLFDYVQRRAPTPEEGQLLADMNHACVALQEYRQCQRFKVLFRVEGYYEVEETKSDNSLIYTSDDQFFVIDSIVSFLDGNNEMCGMFCRKIEVDNPLFGVPHIMTVSNINERQFVPMSSVRGLAFKMRALHRCYVTPMCNNGEID